MSCYPFLDHPAGRHPAPAGQGGPCAADRLTSDIGGLLPIALCDIVKATKGITAADVRSQPGATGTKDAPAVSNGLSALKRTGKVLLDGKLYKAK